ncbi:MAG: DUF4010 domain-containing protein [Spirochaetia bacterium]|nr:DUF4010 domain-containing protein [Spirochaetia bacterium]
METQNYYNLIFAVFIGAAVGIEREHETRKEEAENKDQNRKRTFGGARTFPLASVLGFLSVSFYSKGYNWVFPVSLLVVGLLILVSHYKEKNSLGITTEIAFIITFLLGGLCAIGEVLASAFIMVITVTLLSAKPAVRSWVRQVKEEELVIATKFAVISLVVLPLLPSKLPIPEKIWDLAPDFPKTLINPYEIWLVVVLVAGIGFFGYVINRLMGTSRGTLFTAFAGGLVSSTAVAMDYARRSQKITKSIFLAMGIIIASMIMIPRMLLEAAIFHMPLAKVLFWPLSGFFAGGFFYIVYLYFKVKKQPDKSPQPIITENPMKLKDGILFGSLYLAIRILSYLGHATFGDWGAYAVGFLSGLTDVDAITISMAKSAAENMPLNTAAIAAYLAGAANTLAKGILVVVLAPRQFSMLVFPGFLCMLILGFITLAIAL